MRPFIANVGTSALVINSEDILAYYVYIPRYKYKIWTTSTGSSPQEIEIVFENKYTSKSSGNSVGEYLTHPAFTFGKEEISGFWVGKFETTGDTTTPTVLPNETAITNKNLSTQFAVAIKFAGGNQNGVSVYYSGNSTYGLTANTNAHIMKNSEWGAVSYLAHSLYGINNEVRINNNSSYTTGCGATSANASSSGSCGNYFGSTSNYPQSTTGNITGIFDMSGSAFEYVMGNHSNTMSNSGFDST